MEQSRVQPLADKLRPKNINELVGQEHLLSENGILNRIFQQEKLPSSILPNQYNAACTSEPRIDL